jgi:hypothetical protein
MGQNLNINLANKSFEDVASSTALMTVTFTRTV